MQQNNLKMQDTTDYTPEIDREDADFTAPLFFLLNKANVSYLRLTDLAAVHHNQTPEELYEHAIRRNEVKISADKAIVAITGQHTGRSPNDKYVVRDANTETTIDWGKVNQPYTNEKFNALKERIQEWMKGREIFVQDLFAGNDDDHRLPIRVINMNAWHNLFARNMFVRPQADHKAEAHEPAFTILHVPEFMADPILDETRSSTFVILNFEQKLALIGGTSYAGEVKKTIFTVMNYILPAKGVLPMHASANVGPEGDVAVFFGLSGTGKTTLSADASRTLIGDDEHGWTDKGVFNFEGGCYAKVVRLSEQAEPEIYAASRRFGTVLENVVMNDKGEVDFDDASLTENTRSCYPIDFIPNASETGTAGQPQNIIMLTCDAYGVLPPVSKLTSAQAMYHFLSGYTARVAGTEKGVTEPQATFSTCFGAPFMPRNPEVYAELLGKKIEQNNVNCWLLNTGWSGGAYGTGQRMPIKVTRALLRGILSGSLAKVDFIQDGVFGLAIPKEVEGVDANLLHPRDSWADKTAYDAMAKKLVGLFGENFKRFEAQAKPEIIKAGMGV